MAIILSIFKEATYLFGLLVWVFLSYFIYHKYFNYPVNIIRGIIKRFFIRRRIIKRLNFSKFKHCQIALKKPFYDGSFTPMEWLSLSIAGYIILSDVQVMILEEYKNTGYVKQVFVMCELNKKGVRRRNAIRYSQN
jgi:hypothetical protein